MTQAGPYTITCGYGWYQEADPRFYRVIPMGDYKLIWDGARCVVNDFGDLVRVPS